MRGDDRRPELEGLRAMIHHELTRSAEPIGSARPALRRNPRNTASRARLARMMGSQGLQIISPEDSFARLRIFTNGIVIVNIMFRVRIAGYRCVPVRPLTDGDAEVRAVERGGAVELTASSFKLSSPNSTLVMSMATSSVPVCAGASKMMVPLVLLKRPRQIDTPPR